MDLSAYAELHCASNFSFLRGASHPEELVEQAATLGYAALAITDRNSLAGVVRAHLAAQEHCLQLLVGAEITPTDAPPIILLAPDRAAYGQLARLITRGRLRSAKGQCEIHLADVLELGTGLIAIVLPEHVLANAVPDCTAGPSSHTPSDGTACGQSRERVNRGYCAAAYQPGQAASPVPHAVGPPTAGETRYAFPPYSSWPVFFRTCREVFGSRLYLAAELAYDVPDRTRLDRLADLSHEVGVPLVAANAVHYHVPERRYLQDVLTCIREKCTLAQAGSRLFANAERHLRPLDEIARRYAPMPELLRRTIEIAQQCTFTLDELRYEYPHELVPDGRSAAQYLAELTWDGARRRYAPEQVSGPSPPPASDGATAPADVAAWLPGRVRQQIEAELRLIAELSYEHYFLTVWDLVHFARQRGILCQGRGSAANSAVCYCLGITAVDPARIDLLFERFVSRERNEPPDIDVDFEHERREEVFQYIYEKYGRERAAITAEVISYRPRSAVRDVGKALGLSLDRVDLLAKALDWWSSEAVPDEALRAAGLDPQDRTVQMLVRLVRQLLRFPRHLSQHVGGFVITEKPLCEIVPLQNGAMPARTFIEWDKDDIDALGILKVDCLALGMLTAINKCLVMLNDYHSCRSGDARPRAAPVAPLPTTPSNSRSAAQHLTSRQFRQALPPPPVPRSLTDIPAEDPAVYDLICDADTIGVFQIESRAQMSMLPRLKPRCFYDLVIEVAIVRPGPIQGGMVHPYLRRRDGLEPVTYPSEGVRDVLGKTLGVPLFQEQVMRLAVVAAGFSPGEADHLRRSMAAWRRAGELEQFQTRLVKGMLANGYTPGFAEQIYKQIRGFGEYGFPESHAASFALLVYVSAWLKRYHQAAFTAALLNSQPMGFYAAAQLVRDARNHGVTVRPVDVNASRYDCTLEPNEAGKAGESGPVLRLGFRLVRGLSAEKVGGVEAAQQAGRITSLHHLARQAEVSREALVRLAAADAFRSLGFDRREALWQILALDRTPAPLFAELEPVEPPAALPVMQMDEVVVHDYEALGLSLNAHPIGLVRNELDRLRVSPNKRLGRVRSRQKIAVAGLVTHRQRPGTANGIVFMTLEDETGQANLIVRPQVWERYSTVGRTKVALIAEGTVERQGKVIHVQVSRLFDLSARIAPIRAQSRDFH